MPMLVGLLILNSLVGEVGTDANAHALQAALVGMSANIESMVQFDCRYRLNKAVAADWESARNGRWENVVGHDARLVIDGDRLHYWDMVNAEDIIKRAKASKRAPTRIEAFGVGQHIIAKDGHQVSYDPILKTASLRPAGKAEHSYVVSPLGFLIAGHEFRTGLGRWLRNNSPMVKAIDAETIEGQHCISGVYSDPNLTIRFHLDPNAGYLPRLITTEEAGLAYNEVQTLQTVAVSRGRYFPTRIRKLIRIGPSQTIHVMELTVKELAVDTAPDAESFRFRMPAGTTIQDDTPTTGLTPFFRLKQDELVGPNEIAAFFNIFDEMARRTPDSPRVDTALAPHLPRQWRIWPFLLPTAILLVGFLVLKKWHHQRAPCDQ
jgi:hypothetical protein